MVRFGSPAALSDDTAMLGTFPCGGHNAEVRCTTTNYRRVRSTTACSFGLLTLRVGLNACGSHNYSRRSPD
eukprot:10412963-Lingulodinium_polyedra.AAC.1